MCHSIERLISIRMRMVTMQNQLNACYRSLVKQILDEQLEPEDVEYVRNTMYLDVHNQDLCHLLCKLNRRLSQRECEEYEEEAEVDFCR